MAMLVHGPPAHLQLSCPVANMSPADLLGNSPHAKHAMILSLGSNLAVKLHDLHDSVWREFCTLLYLYFRFMHWLRYLYCVTVEDYKWYSLICWMAAQEYKWYLWGSWECFKYCENADFDTLGIMMQKQ